MLGPDDRLYFIHIPKTAGTSLIPLIDANFAAEAICPAQLWEELVKLPQEQLPNYRLFRGHFGGHGLNPFLPEEPVYMTMLREPLALSYSTYQFVLREPGTRVHELTTSRQMDFEDFVEHPRTRRRVTNRMTHNLAFDLAYTPGTGPVAVADAAVDPWVREHAVRPPVSEQLTLAKERLDECAFFGLVERFDASMALMAYTFRWPVIRQVQKLRVAAQRLPLDDLSTDCRKTLEACNELDMALYAYGCELFEQRSAAMIEDLRASADDPAALPDRFEDDPAAVHEALDRRYRQHRLAQAGEPARRTCVSFDAALPGSGWHGREVAPASQKYFRWTGPEPTANLDLHVRRDVPLRLTFRVIDAIDRDTLESLRVLGDGVELPLEIVSGGRTLVREYQAQLPVREAAGEGLTRLTFAVASTASKRDHQPDNPDTRRLGVAVEWVDLCPATELAAGAAAPAAPKTWAEHGRSLYYDFKQALKAVPVFGPVLVRARQRWRGE